MNFGPSPAVTPFIPPLPSPGGYTPPRPPPVPNPQVHNIPSWAAQTLTAANFPVMYPGTPYTGTPYVPPMDAFTPAAGPALPPGSYFPPPTTLPPQPSFQGANGFSSDYTGYPTSTQWAAPAGPYPQTPYAPAMQPPMMQPPMMQPQTGMNQFQQPLPAAFGGPGWGPQPQQQTPWGMPGQWPGQTPWGYGAPLPPTAQGGPGGQGGQGGPSGHPQQRGPFQGLSERFHLSRASDESDLANKVRFSIGPHYGPVLEPFLVKAVKADVRINPLLHPPEDDLKRPYLKWNMLFPTSTCQRSTDRQGRSWTQGRDEPATFPRVTAVRIVCRGLPWMTTITARNPSVGVTCGELIDTISDNLYRHVSKAEMQSTPNSRAITSAYWHNRSTEADDVPGGRLGDGVRRVDWLLYNTAFCGIVKNDDLARAQCGGEVLPCTFELKCESRFDPDQQLIEQDRLDREERERAARRSNSRSRSRASPRVSII